MLWMLRRRLFEEGLNQAILADRIGISPAGISRIIRGSKKPSPELRRKIAQILKADESELFQKAA